MKSRIQTITMLSMAAFVLLTAAAQTGGNPPACPTGGCGLTQAFLTGGNPPACPTGGCVK